MKRTILVLVVLLLSLFSSIACAAEETSPFYLGILGGYVKPSDMTVHDKTGGLDFDAALKNGGVFGLKAGYMPSFAKGYLATELEYNYIFNTDLDTGKTYATLSGASLDGTNKIHAIFLNFKLRYPEGVLHPYVGIGPGYSWFQAGDLTPSTGTTITGETSSQFCWQLLLGFDYDITKNWGVGLGYKYFQVKPSFGGQINADYDYNAHMITFGVNYAF